MLLDRFGRISALLPNWGGGVKIRHEFKTNVITAYDGTETRDAVRQTPRLRVNFDVMLRHDRARRVMADFIESQVATMAQPLQWRRVELVSSPVLSATIFDVSSVPWWLAEGALVVLSDGVKQEAVTVAGVAGTTVTIEAGLQQAYTAGDDLFHAYTVRPPDSINLEAQTAKLVTGGVQFDVIPGSDPQSYPVPSYPTFEGRDLFLTKPNWRAGLDFAFSEAPEVSDPGYGAPYVESPTNRTLVTEKLLFSGLDLDAAEALVAFFHRKKGKRTSFWMPTWYRDLEVAVARSAGSATVDFNGEDAHYAYGLGADTHDVLYIAHASGAYQVVRVSSTTLAGGDSRFTLEDTLDEAITTDTFVCFCPRWRFATDTLDVNWLTDSVAEMTFAMLIRPSTEGD